MTPFLGILLPGRGSIGMWWLVQRQVGLRGQLCKGVSPTMSPALLLGAGAQRRHVPFTRAVTVLNSSCLKNCWRLRRCEPLPLNSFIFFVTCIDSVGQKSEVIRVSYLLIRDSVGTP